MSGAIDREPAVAGTIPALRHDASVTGLDNNRPRVAFQGERGAFSEEAALKLLGEEIELRPRATFDALFTSIDEGLADFILAPIENTIAGTIRATAELMLRTTLSVLAEVTIPITQNLIGCAGSSFESITVIESHQVALDQCKRFFAKHPHIERIASDDTAGSVFNVMRLGDPTRGAIAGARAAEIYGGVILREHLEDDPENQTRFLLLTNSTEKKQGVSPS